MDASKPGFSVLRRRTERAAGKAGLHRPETKKTAGKTPCRLFY